MYPNNPYNPYGQPPPPPITPNQAQAQFAQQQQQQLQAMQASQNGYVAMGPYTNVAPQMVNNPQAPAYLAPAPVQYYTAPANPMINPMAAPDYGQKTNNGSAAITDQLEALTNQIASLQKQLDAHQAVPRTVSKECSKKDDVGKEVSTGKTNIAAVPEAKLDEQMVELNKMLVQLRCFINKDFDKCKENNTNDGSSTPTLPAKTSNESISKAQVEVEKRQNSTLPKSPKKDPSLPIVKVECSQTINKNVGKDNSISKLKQIPVAKQDSMSKQKATTKPAPVAKQNSMPKQNTTSKPALVAKQTSMAKQNGKDVKKGEYLFW